MGYYLLDNRNPNGDKFYTSRRAKVLAGVVHTAENRPDWDGDDSAAEAVSRYGASTKVAVSWHDTTDSDSRIQMLPLSYTAFHVRGYNSRTVGIEQATQAHRWAVAPGDWVDGILEQTARSIAAWVAEFDLPIRRITKAQLDAGQKGLVAHADLDPRRRSDPGADYPWGRLLEITAAIVGGKVAPEPPKPSGTRYQDKKLLQFGDRGDAVLVWQKDLIRWNSSALPQFGADGGFGGESQDWTRRFQKAAGITADGIVGSKTRGAMKTALSSAPSVGAPAKPKPSGIGPYPGKMLVLTAPLQRGPQVEAWQRGLNGWRKGAVMVDGFYGRVTRDWTKTFQKAAGLAVDGKVGPNTWSAMDRVLRG